MLYQAVMNIGGAKPVQIASGVWECSDKAFSELQGMVYGRIPARTAWSVSLIMKSRI